jgi:uncharacterized protein
MSRKVNRNYRSALKLEREGGEPSDVLVLLKSASAEGSADADYALGTLYLHGKYVAPEPEIALKYLRTAAVEMHPAALFDLGNALETGEIVDQDLRGAFRCYLHAMIFGDRDAIYEVARCFYYGIGTRKDRVVYEDLVKADEFHKRKKTRKAAKPSGS